MCVCRWREQHNNSSGSERGVLQQAAAERALSTHTDTQRPSVSKAAACVDGSTLLAHYSSTLPESSTPAAARFDQIQETFLVPVLYPCSFSIHSRHCEPMRLDWLAIVRYEVFCYALVALLHYVFILATRGHHDDPSSGL